MDYLPAYHPVPSKLNCFLNRDSCKHRLFTLLSQQTLMKIKGEPVLQPFKDSSWWIKHLTCLPHSNFKSYTLIKIDFFSLDPNSIPALLPLSRFVATPYQQPRCERGFRGVKDPLGLPCSLVFAGDWLWRLQRTHVSPNHVSATVLALFQTTLCSSEKPTGLTYHIKSGLLYVLTCIPRHRPILFWEIPVHTLMGVMTWRQTCLIESVLIDLLTFCLTHRLAC